MKFNPDKHHRRSVRLKGYDYRKKGDYFITICTALKEPIFGEIKSGKIILNSLGELIENQILETEKIRENIKIDSYVIMPNHLHMIISIIDKTINDNLISVEKFGSSLSNSIPTIVRLFKSSVTKRAKGLDENKFISVWQRNYYEHVIRNRAELKNIREYIKRNPECWIEDEYYINS